MSIAYLDPGNIESDLQSGAVAKFKVKPVQTKSCAFSIHVLANDNMNQNVSALECKSIWEI